jgi:hypothetical protein
VEKILRVTSRHQFRDDLAQAIAALETAAVHGRTDAVIAGLKALTGLVRPGEEIVAAPAPVQAAPVAAAVEVKSPVEQPCPHCHGLTLHRSKARNLPERIRRSFSPQRLFRCSSCDWRGWLLPLQFSEADTAEPSSAPNFAALDAALNALRPQARRSFSPQDLQ